METTVWKTGVERHIPALEAFLKNVLLRKYKVSVNNSSKEKKEVFVQTLEKSAVVVRAVEEKFNSEIVFGFSNDWVILLNKVILDVHEPSKNEITQDLFREFIIHWLEVLREAFEKAGIELKFSDMEPLKQGQLKRMLKDQEYLTAILTADQKFAVDNEDPSSLEFTIGMTEPDRESIEVLVEQMKDDNPFLNGDFEKVSTQIAGLAELERVSKNTPAGDAEEQESAVKVKGEGVEFEEFDKSSQVENNREISTIGFLKDVKMNVSVELGHREMSLGNVLKLVRGSVIELEKLAGEPVEILVNGHTIAQGDVVVIDEHFGVRISNLLTDKENIKELG